jgi:hypothetical protein
MSWDIRAIPQGYHDELFRCLKWLGGCLPTDCTSVAAVLRKQPSPSVRPSRLDYHLHPHNAGDTTLGRISHLFLRGSSSPPRFGGIPCRLCSSGNILTTIVGCLIISLYYTRLASLSQNHVAFLMGVPSNVTEVSRVRVRCAGV